MPSNEYSEESLDNSGVTHTATANGFWAVAKTANEVGQYFDMVSNMNFIVSGTAVTRDTTVRLTCPAKNGDTVTTNYITGGQTGYFRFIKDVGTRCIIKY